MLSAEEAQRITYDEETNTLTVFYRDRKVMFEGCARDQSAPEFNRKTLFQIEDRMTFNIAGVTAVSFINRSVKSAWCSGRRPKHLRDCTKVPMVKLRPWLNGECKSCVYGDRKGSFGHYFLQKSMIAASLT